MFKFGWFPTANDDERLPLIHGAENPRTVVVQLTVTDDVTHDANVVSGATDMGVMFSPPNAMDNGCVNVRMVLAFRHLSP